MIRRIVKMKFRKECIEEFIEIFNASKEKIELQPGCYSVELLVNVDDPAMIFTYSIWEDEASLHNYRNSTLFSSVWPKTKALFSHKPEAWSLEYLIP